MAAHRLMTSSQLTGLAGACLSLVLMSAAPVTAAPAQPQPSQGASSTTAPAADPLTPIDPAGASAVSGTPVTLPTGDVVDVISQPDGRVSAVMREPAAEGTDGLAYTLDLGGQLHVIPAAAQEEFGSEWTAEDFNVTQLADVDRPRSGTDSDLSLAPDRRQGQAFGPAWWMQTLSIQAIDFKGAPANNVPFVVLNVDDMTKYAYYGFMSAGLRKLSVPAGRYAVIAFFTHYDPQTQQYSQRIVAEPEITLSPERGEAIKLDARDATSRLSVETPRPSERKSFSATLFRSDAHGVGTSFGFTFNGDRDIFVKPTGTPVSRGRFEFTSSFRNAAADGSYTYDLVFPHSGSVPPDTHYEVEQDELATVDATYKADVAGKTEGEHRTFWMPWQNAGVQHAQTLVTPARRTEYITGDPSVIWQQGVTTALHPLYTAGVSIDSYRSYVEGQHESTTWRGDPTHPSVQYDFGANGQPMACPACRRGNAMHLALYPFGDNTPGHVTLRDLVFLPGAGGIDETTSFQVYRDGELYAEALEGLGTLVVPSDDSTYEFVYDNTRTSPWWTLSTSQRTTWTFDSSSADETDPAPPGWVCGTGMGSDCSVLPLLLPYVDLPTDDLGLLDPGTATVPFGVRHLQHSSSSPVSAAMEVSYDGGGTWQDVPVTPGEGDGFTALLDVPAPEETDGFGALRLNAADEEGHLVRQTVIRAFAVTGAESEPPDPDPDDPPGPGDPEGPEEPDPDPSSEPACEAPTDPTRARCFAMVNTRVGVQRVGPNALPQGYGPADLRAAYNLTHVPTRGHDQTIAVVVAYGNPAAEKDMTEYRRAYGLPPCSVDSGCLRIVNQRGDPAPRPRPNYDWGLETVLDLAMVSAICSTCRILLVEADSNKIADLAAAAETAGDLGADAITNSYGVTEFTGMESYASSYAQPDSFITVASGDNGFGIASFPANLATVTAVGGTTLRQDHNLRGWSETAWGHGDNSALAGGAGSGCSAYVDKPGYQDDSHCPTRMVSDVSMVADPATGVAVFESNWRGGWVVAGGTSAAAPMIAATAALTGNAARLDNAHIYEHRRHLYDIAGGSNGSCGGDYLCTGTPGYDGPTGLGTPNGIGAF